VESGWKEAALAASRLRSRGTEGQSNLHHFREVGNFGAHTRHAATGRDAAAEPVEPEVIDVDRDEADGTLDLVDRLLDYFIIQPARDESIRRSIDKKLEKAGRRPLQSVDEPDNADAA
jgi:hypothetical protein